MDKTASIFLTFECLLLHYINQMRHNDHNNLYRCFYEYLKLHRENK